MNQPQEHDTNTSSSPVRGAPEPFSEADAREHIRRVEEARVTPAGESPGLKRVALPSAFQEESRCMGCGGERDNGQHGHGACV